MTLQQASPNTTAPKPHAFPTRLALVGAATLLTVAAGGGAWQVAHSGSTSKPITSLVRPLSGSTGVASVPASRDGNGEAISSAPATDAAASTSSARPATHSPTAGPVIYLTASADARAAAESDLDAAATIRRAIGDTSPLPQVAVVTSADGEAQLRQTIADENQLRAGLGLPDITVVDLRTTAGPADPAPSVVRPGDTASSAPITYVVGSDEEGRRLGAELATVAPETVQVVMVSGASDAGQMRQIIDDLNAVRHSLGVPEMRLVDLRSPDGATTSQP